MRPLRMAGLEEDEAVAVTPAPPPRAQDVGAAGLPTVEKKRRSRLSSLFSPVFSALGLVAADAGEKRAVEMATPAALLSPGDTIVAHNVTFDLNTVVGRATERLGIDTPEVHRILSALRFCTDLVSYFLQALDILCLVLRT